MTHRNAIAAQDGFTVAEYIMAIAILLVVIVASIGALSTTATNSVATAKRDKAISLANAQIEMARNQPYDDLGSVWPSTNPSTNGDYTIRTEVGWARDAASKATCRLVTVFVDWTKPYPGQVKLQSQIAGKPVIAVTGDVVVKVQRDDDGTIINLPGASVVLTPSAGAVQRITSDSDGIAFFGHVASGTFAFRGRISGYLIDMSQYQLNPPSVTGGLTTTCTVTAYTPSSYTYTFVDGNGVARSDCSITMAGNKPDMRTLTRTNPETGVYQFSDLLPDTYNSTPTVPVSSVIWPPYVGGVSLAQNQNLGRTITAYRIGTQTGGFVIKYASSGTVIKLYDASKNLITTKTTAGSPTQVSFSVPPGTYYASTLTPCGTAAVQGNVSIGTTQTLTLATGK